MTRREGADQQRSRRRRRLVVGFVCTAAVGLSVGTWLGHAAADRAATAPPIVYSGQVLLDGTPIEDGDHSVGLSLWRTRTGATGGLCDQGVVTAATRVGHFSVTLTPECANAFEAEETVYVQMSVDGTELNRTRAGAVPYAMGAEHARILDAPRRVVATAASYNGRIADARVGSLVGYAAARAICRLEMDSSTAHLCYGSELVRALQEEVLLPSSPGIYASESGYTDSNGAFMSPYFVVGDCAQWTSAVDSCGTNTTCNYQPFGDGPRPCSASLPLYCCD